jgi:hypothetical protein
MEREQAWCFLPFRQGEPPPCTLAPRLTPQRRPWAMWVASERWAWHEAVRMGAANRVGVPPPTFC